MYFVINSLHLKIPIRFFEELCGHSDFHKIISSTLVNDAWLLVKKGLRTFIFRLKMVSESLYGIICVWEFFLDSSLIILYLLLEHGVILSSPSNAVYHIWVFSSILIGSSRRLGKDHKEVGYYILKMNNLVCLISFSEEFIQMELEGFASTDFWEEFSVWWRFWCT